MERMNHRHLGWTLGSLLALLQVCAVAETAPPAAESHMCAWGMHHHGGTAGMDGSPDGAGCAGPGGKWISRIEELNLTAEQQLAIQAIMERYRNRALELAQRGTVVREQFTSVLPTDAGYDEATEKAAETAAALMADGIRLMSALRAEVHGVLTPEQRDLMNERMQAERQRWDDWRSRHQSPQ